MYYDYSEDAEGGGRKWLWWAVPVVVVVALGGALYYGYYSQKQEPAVQQAKTEPDAEPAATPPERNTIEPAANAPSVPLPALGASDPEVSDALSGVFGDSLAKFLVPKDIVRHFVVTIDNLPRKKNPAPMWPVKTTPGEFVAEGPDQVTMSVNNYARYEPIMTLMKNTDVTEVAKLYKRFYPLFQQAYEELGYPDGYFNDRLIAVIDHLLETPEVKGPIVLNQPRVYYEFADPALEQRSAGQKLLIRMGPANAASIKLKLRELRREVAQRS